MRNNDIKNEVEKVQLITREYFMKVTDTFVTPLYYEYIYDYQLKEKIDKSLPIVNVLNQWLEENATMIIELDLNETFKYISDDEIECSIDISKPSITEVINRIVERYHKVLKQRDRALDYIERLDNCLLKATRFLNLQKSAFNLFYDEFQDEIIDKPHLTKNLLLIIKSIQNIYKKEINYSNLEENIGTDNENTGGK